MNTQLTTENFFCSSLDLVISSDFSVGCSWRVLNTQKPVFWAVVRRFNVADDAFLFSERTSFDLRNRNVFNELSDPEYFLEKI